MYTPPAPQDERGPLPPVIDHEVLDDLRSVLGDEMDRLIDVFLDDTPLRLSPLENAVDALRDAAHSLTSSSANLGAMSLSAAPRRIETGAHGRSLEDRRSRWRWCATNSHARGACCAQGTSRALMATLIKSAFARHSRKSGNPAPLRSMVAINGFPLSRE